MTSVDTADTSASMTYDVVGRPSTATSPYGAVTNYTYSSTNPNLIVTTTGTRIVNTTLDGLGRTIKVETGDSNGVQSVVETQYDSCACSPLGKVTQVSQPHAPGDPPPPVYWTVYGYDALGRTTTITLPDGSVSSYSYSGNTTTVTDPAGKWKTYTTDVMGNLTQVTEPAPEGGTHLTTYAYNVLNQLTTVTMPRSTGTQTRTFNYDFTGNYPYSGPTARLTSVTNPESGTTSFEYNDDGSLFRKTDAKGQKIKLTYDTLGRVTVKQTYKSDGTEDLCGKATNYWDTRPSGVGGADWENVSGRLMAVRWSASTCPGGQFTEGYQYDTGLLSIKRLYAPPLGANSYIDASFTYTDQGQLQSMAYPVWHGGGTQWPTAGKTFTYNLDTLSRPISLTDEGQTAWVSGVTYGGANGPAGQMTAMSYGGYTQTFTYNTRGQLTNLTAGGTGLARVDLRYNFAATPANDGRLMQMEDAVSGEVVNYLYDSLGRLTDAHTDGTQWGQTFSYDGFGNLTDEARIPTKDAGPTVHRNYDPATNRLTLDYTYDANGNMTAMPGLGMTYNVENRLTQATSNLNGTESYGYDAAGLRLWKQGPDSITHVYYNGPGGKPLADFYLSGGTMAGGTPMVYFAGKRVDNVSVEDRLGTVVVESGTSRMVYFPYGELRSGTSTEVQFATYKRDSTTNLDYAQQRYYSTQIARFSTVDPAPADPAEPQSWNRYNYVVGDPANQVDPDGLTPIYGPIGRSGGSLLCMEDIMMGDDWRRPPGMFCSPIPGTESGPMKPWRTSYPDCNPTGNPVMEKKLNFVAANYGDALQAAKTLEAKVTNPGVSADDLATMFLQWSLGEAGYPGDSKQVTAQNNLFGQQYAGVGGWGGTEIACDFSNKNIDPKTTNACFPSSLTLGAELTAVLGTASGKTGVTWGQSIQNALQGGASSTLQVMQALVGNGWNSKNQNYAQDVVKKNQILSAVDCLQGTGAIPQ